MILPFSQKFKDGTPTHFIEKIWAGFLAESIFTKDIFHEFFNDQPTDLRNLLMNNWEPINNLVPKLHTIRADAHDRWHAGRMIHPVINNRSKNQFQFAPAFPCISTQKIEIKYGKLEKDDETLKTIQVIVDGRFLETNEIKILAKNDGFESDAQFLAWFDHDFTGKIIHWTNLKY